MPKYKSNLEILDREKPLELVLELASFSGGENTKGGDVELKNNEARIIENWDALSLGGMIRSKGLKKVASSDDVKLLLHCDGADEATTFIDETGKTVTAKETAQIDTAQKVFGTASGLFDGNSDYLEIADSVDWALGGIFTLERRVRFKTLQDAAFFAQYEGVAAYWFLYYDHANTQLRFINYMSPSNNCDIQKNWVPVVDTWYHIAVIRDGTTTTFYIDGTSIGDDATVYTITDINSKLYIGQKGDGSCYHDGWADEIRISKGIARWTANFTPPTGPYTLYSPLDLLAHHLEGASTVLYGVAGGDLIIKSGAGINQEDAAAFTSGLLCHAISKGNALWITNSTDNLLRKIMGNPIAAPADKPASARARMYYHKFRLIAEGGGKVVYGSRAGSGNWTEADAWSLANDAWDITMPDITQGCAPGFPSGLETSVFTKFKTFSLYNFPDIAYREIPNSCGCENAHTIARGNEGVFFLSNFPTLGIYLWNAISFIELTIKHDFIKKIDLTKRMFGVYRDGKYFFFYNESGSGVTYPNRLKIYDTKFGRWMTRPVNAAVDDNFGYPALLKHDNNELYIASSQKDKIYELETDDNSDEGQKTEANYKTKDVTSRDFALATGGQFPIDEVRLKLIKATIVYFGITGNITIQWTADRGLHSGSQIIPLTAEGDLINETFVVNVSKIISLPADRIKTLSFNNSAVGRRFNFQILNNATGERPKIKKIKIHAIALEEA